MATSGTSSFNYNRDQIIRAALRKIGAISAGEVPDNQTIQDAADSLNLLVKEYDAIGLHLWTESEGILFLQPNQIQYAFGPGSTDHATKTNPPNYVSTTVSSSSAQFATTVTLTSVANILVGDNIGITLDSGTVFWSTVASINTTSRVVTITTALPSSAGATGLLNPVFDYTSSLQRPLRVLDARLLYYSSAIETPMFAMSRLDYRDLPSKNNTGTPTSFYYDAQLGQGLFYVWPAPLNAGNGVKFTWMRQIEDFNTAANTPDLPVEWIACLTWGLACELALEYDIPPARYQILKSQYAEKLDRVTGFDREIEPIYFGVSNQGQYSGGSGH